jgi:hypothetical protein
MPKAIRANIGTVQQIERIEARCRAGHNALYPPDSRERRHLETIVLGGASVELSGTPKRERIGRVYGFGVFKPATEASLDAILQTLSTAQASQIRFRVPPTGQRAEITEWLTERGLRRSTFVVHWIAATVPVRPVETGYVLRRAGPSEVTRFGELIALHYHLKEPGSAAFHARLEEIPGMACFMAFDGDTAIGTGATYYDGAGCILEYGTTLGPYRKQGLQKAMIGYRLNIAAAAGCEWACASTIGADRSSRNLVRQGFVKAYDAPIFVQQLTASST